MAIYLKKWQGFITGSFAGRDDGYPETKLALIESLDDLVASYNPKAEYFCLEKVDVASVVRAIKDLNKKD